MEKRKTNNTSPANGLIFYLRCLTRPMTHGAGTQTEHFNFSELRRERLEFGEVETARICRKTTSV